jgi:DNA polymerase-3 subunit delta'
LKAAAGGWRVVIVDCADDLNRNSANALLKLLEEPPARAVLLMVCHAPGRLLPTIRSRCRRLTLGPLSATDVDGLLMRYCPDLSSADRALLVHLANGSIGRALEIANVVGLDLCRDIAGQLQRLPQLDVARLHALGDRLGQKDSAGMFSLAGELLIGWLGRLIEVAATGQGTPAFLDDDPERLGALVRSRELDQWLKLWDKATHLFARTEAVNLDRKQVWVGVMLDIASPASR